MKSTRMTAVIVGALFLTATITTMVGDSLIVSVLNSPDYLSIMYPSKNQVITGVLVAFVDVLAVAGIGVLLFPILKKQNEAMAFGYAGIRIAEFPILLLWLLSPLLLITLSQEYVNAAAPDVSSFQTLGAVLIGLRLWSWRLIYIINGIATLLLASLLFQSRLVPRWLSLLGLVGGVMLLAGTSISMLGYFDVDQGAGMLAVLPGGLFEFVLPIWLFVKGFDTSVIASMSQQE